MAKILVVESGDTPTKIPFLRGILTRSLQEAGLPFGEAYALASAVRDELSDTAELSTAELRRRVLKHMSGHDTEIVERYQQPTSMPGAILIRDGAGDTTPFSREQHRRILESSGLSYEESTSVTSAIYGHMVRRNMTEIRSRDLGLLTYRYLRRAKGSSKARRYLALVDYLRGSRPIVLLIGGASGTGKSSVATEIAHRLEIARSQSTDLLREVMRMMIPKRLAPVLHRSSYDAWRVLSDDTASGDISDDDVVDGYRAQAKLLSVPCEAVIARSLREQSSLIIEGVHVQKSLIETIPAESEAVVVFAMLAVLDPAQLRDRFRGRGKQIDKRRAERYLQHFDEIWSLQTHLLSEADRGQVPIIVNNNKEQIIRDVIGLVVDALVDRLDFKPSEVFT